MTAPDPSDKGLATSGDKPKTGNVNDANNPLSTRRMRTLARQRTAFQMRLAGATEYEIAQSLGVTQPAVHKLLTQARQDVSEQVALDQEEYKRIQRTDIFAGLSVVRNSLASNDPGERLAAIDRMGRLHERLAKLEGLDAPEKKDFAVKGIKGYTTVSPDDWPEPTVPAKPEEPQEPPKNAPA
jgi:hypothetical protein